jgi:hypothetical protein
MKMIKDLISNFKKNTGLLKEIWQLIVKNKKWWLIPFFLVLCLFVFSIILVGGGSILPAIYTLF